MLFLREDTDIFFNFIASNCKFYLKSAQTPQFAQSSEQKKDNLQ